MAKSLAVGEIIPFDCTGDITSVGPRWRRWKTAFQFFIDGKEVTDPKQKRALFFHSAGMDVQEVYLTLEGAAGSSKGEDEYEEAMNILDHHFTPQINVPFDR